MNKKIKTYLFSGVILLSITIMTLFATINQETMDLPNQVFQIYLDGKEIGTINDDQEFYDLINDEQKELKEKYQVNQVYPPNGFEIVAYNTYDEGTTSAEEIYNNIKNQRNFTIKGYKVTIKSTDEEENTSVLEYNVLNEKIFNEAMESYITTFVDSQEYQDYINENQQDIEDVGQLIEDMYFEETITIKEAYLNTEEIIFTNSNELAKTLLFGENTEINEYTVKTGDNLESIAYDNKLNVQELLIANENIKSKDTILAIGQKINVALLDPQLTLIYDLKFTEMQEQPYETERILDATKYSGYKQTSVAGINGLHRATGYVSVVNGQMNQDAYFPPEEIETIRPPQNEVVVYGTAGGSYVPTGDAWGYPTNFPYKVTSEYGYRWGTIHDGIDISGTGYASPIYAVLEGTVINAGRGGIAGTSAGINVVIEHPNGYYTIYAHLSHTSVSVGSTVSKGTVVGGMGDTGVVTGTHLHLGVFIGLPYNGGYAINPRNIIMF